jgi:hypothetical protein
MPALKNQKHEIFCRKLIEAAKRGKSQGWAYTESGYKADGHGADVCASRLLKNADIERRLSELGEPMVRKTRISVESLLDELETTVNDARADGQHSVVVNALTLSAKLVGLLRDRIEVGGPGDFAGAETIDDCLQVLLADQSPSEAIAALDLMRQEIERFAGDHAEIAAPLVPRVNELAESLRVTRRRN